MRKSKLVSLSNLLILALGTCSSVFAIDNALRVTVTNLSNGASDQSVVRFLDEASLGFDSSYDAYKLFTSNPLAPSLFSVSSESYPLSINAMPSLEHDYAVDLVFLNNFLDSFKFTFEILGAFDSATTITLEDMKDNAYDIVNEQLEHHFQLHFANDTTPRFRLHFSIPPQLSAKAVCPSSAESRIIVSDVGAEHFDVIVLDSNGQTVYTKLNAHHEDSTTFLETGNYQVISKTHYGLVDTQSIQVMSFPEIEIEAYVLGCTSPSSNDGAIEIEIVQGDGPFMVLWSDDADALYRSNLEPGRYSVSITDTHNCQRLDSFEIEKHPSEFVAPKSGLTQSKGDALGADDLHTSFQAITHPNPTKRYMNIEASGRTTDEVSGFLYDLNGALVLEVEPFYESTTLDCEGMVEGVYFLQLVQNEKVSIERVVVQR